MSQARRRPVAVVALTVAATTVATTVATAAVARAGTTFSNPLAAGADPWVQLVNGTYYYTDTTGGDLMVGQGATPMAAVTASARDVYRMPSGTSAVWAPELHFSAADQRWYAYYSAVVSGKDHRLYVLQSSTASATSTYTLKGQLTDSTDKWAIDGTTLDYAGKQYAVWSGWPGDTNVTQNLYLAPMSNAWTVSGSRTQISAPTQPWETVGTPTVNEGPEVLTHNGTTTIIYSASGSWTDSYNLGELKLTGTDPTVASSWTKVGSVFASANGVYGPGHASFTTSDNGTRDWIVYHAAVSSGAGWNRNVRAQPFSWNPDGTPSFGQPVPVTVPIQWGPTSWVGAINASNNDSAHAYLSAANWVGAAVTDSLANVTLTDDTTLYLNADHATAGDWTLTYGSGQKFLAFQSDSTTNRTVTLNGNVTLDTLGGANSVYLSTAARPLTLAMGDAQRTFTVAADDNFSVDGNLTGTAGLAVAGGGTVTFRGGGKTYAGPTVVANGTLRAGDGSTTGTAGGTLPPNSVISLATAGTLRLAGLSGAAQAETVAGLTGTGAVVGANAAGATLTIANPADAVFAGSITGSALSIAEAGPAAQTLSGTSTYGGVTAVTGGTLRVTGTVNGTAGLRLSGGTAAVDGTVTTTGFSSAGLNRSDTGTIAVAGTLTVHDSLNVGDNGTGSLTVAPGGAVAVETLYVAKFGVAAGTVTQTGGAVTSLAGGTDWRIGGATGTADAAAVGVYNLNGGTVADAYNLQVGAYGRGTVNQTGGTATVSGYLSVGRYGGAVGNLNVSGGSLVASAQPVLIVGEQGTGTLRVSAAGTVAAQQLTVGHNGGVGTVAQTGGTVTATAGVLLARAAGGTGAYTLSGGTLNAASVARGAGTGSFTFDGGTLTPTADSAAFVAGLTSATVTTSGGTVDTAAHTVTVAQPFTGPGGLTKAGPGTLTLTGANTYAGVTTVAAGTLALSPTGSVAGGLKVAATAALTWAAQTPGRGLLARSAGPLTVDGTAAVMAAAAPADRSVLLATALSVAGTLDLANNDAIVRNASVADVTALAATGFAGGSWNGSAGLVSSAAATDPAHLSALAVVPNAGPLYATFDGQPATAADVLVRFTLYGDANLDGTVNAADYTRMDAGSVAGLTGWANGDVNYDGVVDGSDYALADNAFNSQGAGGAVATAAAQVAAVPEPAGLLAALAVAGLARRRPRANAPKRATMRH